MRMRQIILLLRNAEQAIENSLTPEQFLAQAEINNELLERLSDIPVGGLPSLVQLVSPPISRLSRNSNKAWLMRVEELLRAKLNQ
jgi:hypothetical protein